MSSFKISGFLVHIYPEADAQRSYAHAAYNYKTEIKYMRVTPLGFCLRVIVNEIPKNLDKTTSSVLYVIVI